MGKSLRLSVIVYDFSAMMHVGGSGSTTVRTFDLPPDALAFLSEQLAMQNQTVSLAIHEELTNG
jgi:hypothetical protein